MILIKMTEEYPYDNILELILMIFPLIFQLQQEIERMCQETFDPSC